MEVNKLATAHEALKRVQGKAAQAKTGKLPKAQTRVIVGTATCGVSAGARTVVEALNDEINTRNLAGAVVTETGCSGRCDLEPLVQVQKEGEAPVLYYHVDAEKARRIVQQHVQMGEIIQDWVVT